MKLLSTLAIDTLTSHLIRHHYEVMPESGYFMIDETVTDIPDFFSVQLYPRFYWRSSFKPPEMYYGSIFSGSLIDCQNLMETRRDPGILFCGGQMQFQHKAKLDLWRNWEEDYFFIPKFSLCTIKPGEYSFSLRFLYDQKPSLESLLQDYALPIQQNNDDSSPFPVPRSYTLLPDVTQWEQNIQRFQKQTELHKVVLSRQVTLELESVSPLRLLNSFPQSSFVYAFETVPGEVFLGATPEKLYTRQDSCIQSEAIAGTRPRGQNAAQDQRLKEQLLHSTKDREEHALVLKYLKEIYDDLCRENQISELDIVQTQTVQHLYQVIEGQLNGAIKDSDILSSLSPTPAVAGYPKTKARAFLAEHEPFHRGLYASPIGRFSKSNAEFVVALRCALLQHHQLTLFSGAGIVKSSKAQAEWAEINLKLKHYLDVMNLNIPGLEY